MAVLPESYLGQHAGLLTNTALLRVPATPGNEEKADHIYCIFLYLKSSTSNIRRCPHFYAIRPPFAARHLGAIHPPFNAFPQLPDARRPFPPLHRVVRAAVSVDVQCQIPRRHTVWVLIKRRLRLTLDVKLPEHCQMDVCAWQEIP